MKPRKLTRRKVTVARDELRDRMVPVVVIDECTEVHATPAESEISARPRRQSGTQARRGGTNRKRTP